MANTTSTRTQIIATNYDGAVYGNGLAIYGAPSAYGAQDSTVLVLPGQVVFYNPTTGLSTGTTATRATVPNLQIGVGIDLNQDGIAEDIRWFNDGMNGCGMLNHSGRLGECGLPSITDAVWGDCLECNQTYTIEVQVYDPITESFGERGIGYIYHFTYHYPCGDCPTGDCVDPTPSPEVVMCGLYNKIKGIHNDPNWDITLNSIPVGGQHEYLFDVAQLYNGASSADLTTYEYCLTAADSTCDNCDDYTAVGGYNFGIGEGEDIVFSPATFTGTISKKAQLERAVSNLNAAFIGVGGSAVFLPAVGNCCTNNKIEVNTCLLNFELNDENGTAITPCENTNPFSDLTVYSECQDCDNTNSTTTFSAGLRFFSKPVQGKCDCIPGNHSLVEYFSEVEVYFKRGWEKSKVNTVKRQYATLPKGQGFQWQSREIVALQDGFTEPFHINLEVGKYGLPGPTDQRNQVTVNCKDSYCVLGGTYGGKTKHENTGETSFVPEDIYLLIPTDHTVAQTSILLAWNNFFSGGDCGLATISCAAWNA